jgi:hypothetical protein
MFANMETFLSVETYMGLVHKWSTCSREEWLQGSEGAQFTFIVLQLFVSARRRLVDVKSDLLLERH